jgi:PKD repeat protein
LGTAGRTVNIGSSEAAADGVNAIACTGCHVPEGLRAHHAANGVTLCAGCHPNDPAPQPENIAPPWYGSVINDITGTNLEPCNAIGEEQLAGDTIGLDNDGDNAYDTADPDCAINQPPVADPNGPYTGTIGVPVHFDGSGSYDPDGTIIFYEWDFGDGNTGGGVNPTHIYASPGLRTVTLIVVDDDGSADAASTTAEINLVNCPDTYEPDDNSTQSTALLPGVPQTHSICPVGDKDWYTFTLTAESEIVLETSGLSGDTRMWLFDSGLTQIEFNDNGGADLWSLIDRQCDNDALPPGTYYIQIDDFGDNNEIQSYDISLTATPCTCPVDIEAIYGLVTWYYQSILDREPETEGLEYWYTEMLRITALGLDIKEGFIALGKEFFNSVEYIEMDKTDEQYLEDLYWTFLGRGPDAGGKTFWLDQLAGGLSRNMVLNNFVFSPEFRDYMVGIFGDCGVRPEYNLLNDQYRGLLSRLPEDEGYIFWLGHMQTAQCTGEAAVRDLTSQIGLLFINSQEYIDKGRSNSEFLEDLYDAIQKRAPDLSGHLFWLGLLNSGALSREEVLQEFVNSLEFQGRVLEVIVAGCIVP